MRQPMTTADRTLLAASTVAAIGWLGVVAIGWQLAISSAAALGFDLELLLQAGRDAAAGHSPYAAELVGGGAPTATDLFYSYPPPVAQVMALAAPLPSYLALLLWDALAVLGLLLVAELLRRRLAPDRSRRIVLATCAAAAPLTLPFAVGLLFGNLDVFFPLLYGTMLLAVVSAERSAAITAGIALAVASVKLHPASMGLWFLVRALRGHDGAASRTVVLTGLLVGAGIVAVSLLIGGSSIWSDYLEVVRAGTNAVIVDPRNAGPAALIVGAVGGDDGVARGLHLAVGIAAVAVTIWAAWRRGDAVEGFAWATAASLCTLPVTWYHYPSAFLPIAIAAWLRADQTSAARVRWTLLAAMIVAAIAIAALPLLWLAIGLVILAARWSRPASSPIETEAPTAPALAGG